MFSINDIKERNMTVGHHFFDDATMRFFESKVYDKVFGTHFVTSERGPTGLRRYSVRQFNWDTGAVETVGDFQQYDSLSDAYREAERLGRNEVASDGS